MTNQVDPAGAVKNLATYAQAETQPAADAQYGRFYQDPPQIDDANGRTWITRGQNFIIAYTEARPGGVFTRDNQPDEYMLIVPDEKTPFTASSGAQKESSDGYAVGVLPPGQSTLTFPEGGRFARLFSSQAEDLAAQSANAAAYEERHPNIPPYQPWPGPKDGYKLRLYSLDVPAEAGRMGRIFRCSTLMFNITYPKTEPRDPDMVFAPHHHDDFEQCSLALAGNWNHYLRWPWSIHFSKWRADAFVDIDSPSVTIIPPPVIHTSAANSIGAQLVDVWAPPRPDFVRNKGWVLNETDYPNPEG